MFQSIYGTWDPRAPYGHATDMRWARIPHGLAGLLLDQQFGLLPNAPIYLLALGGFVALWRRDRRLTAELLHRNRAIRGRGGGLSHVVGRTQFAGALPRAGAAAPGDAAGRVVDRGDQSNRTRGRRWRCWPRRCA